MRVVVHMGMHKTGSSSIQGYFHRTELPGVAYLRFQGPNHSGIFTMLFDDDERVLRSRTLNENGTIDLGELLQRRASGVHQFAAQMRVLQGTDATAIFSAEQISAPRFVNARARLHAFLRGFTEDLAVVGYVRSPLSYAVSAFQQRLRSPQRLRDEEMCVLPVYRDRFEQMDDLFGRDRVQLVPFTPAALHGGDVVMDFAHRIGVELPGAPPERLNEALSLEAAALLYLHRTQGAGRLSGIAGATAINREFAQRLRALGRTRFTFAPELWQPQLHALRDDLEWIRDRLGTPLEDTSPPAYAETVASPAQLLDIADRQGPALEALVAGCLEDFGPEVHRRGLPSAAGLTPRAHVLEMLALLLDGVRARHDARQAVRQRRGQRPGAVPRPDIAPV